MIGRLARALLPLACFLAVGSLLMVIATRSGTAEHVVSILSLVLGLVVVGACVVALRLTIPRDNNEPFPSPSHNAQRSTK